MVQWDELIKTILQCDDYVTITLAALRGDTENKFYLGRPDSERHIANGDERSVNLLQLQVLVLCIIFTILYSLYRVVSWYIIYEYMYNYR